MEEKQKPQNTQYHIYTNSIIELTVPNDDIYQKNIHFGWKNLTSKSLMLGNSQFPSGKRANQYRCSPLDYGSILNVTIRDGFNGNIFETMNYGPIKIQPQLCRETECFKETYDVGVDFSKYFVKKATLKVKGNTDIVKVDIKIDSFQTFEIYLNKEIKNQLGKDLFRVYHDEPNCIGIYIYHQYEKLKQILKKLKLWTHYGYYLKIILPDRLTRDALICHLLRTTGTIITELQPFFSTFLFKKQKKLQIKVQFGEVQNHTKKIRETKKMNIAQKNKEKEVPTKKIKFQQDNLIQDIYNILYTPTSNIPIEDNVNRFQFETSKKKTKNFPKLLKSQILESFGSSTENVNDKDSVKTVTQSIAHESEEEMFKKKFGSIIIEEPVCGQKLIQLSKKKKYEKCQSNTLLSYNNEDKFEKLSREYAFLQKENQKLREENNRLKFENGKGPDPTTNNMKKIRQLVSLMAKRLQYLQSMQLNAKKVKTLKQIPNSSEEYHDISTLASQKSIKRNTNVILQNNEMSSRKVSERKSKKFEVNKSNYPKFFYRSPQNVHESKTFMNQNNVFQTPKWGLSPANNSHSHLRTGNQFL